MLQSSLIWKEKILFPAGKPLYLPKLKQKDMILITGATGFLGQFLVDECLSAGYTVRTLVREPEKRSLPWGKEVEITEGDVLDIMSLERAMENVTFVIHAAATVSFEKKDRSEMFRTNVSGTANVVNVALAAGIQKLVHVSSIAAIGRSPEVSELTADSKWTPGKLNSDYALSKRQAELEVQRGVVEGLPAVILNPGVIIGPGDWTSGTASLFGIVDKGLRFCNVGVNGYVGVKDVAKGIRLAMESPNEAGQRFILVSENLSQKAFFGMIARELDKNPPRIEFPPFLSMLAGGLLELLGSIRKKGSLINRQSMRISTHRFRYDGSPVESLGLSYTPMKTVIQETAAAYLAEKGKSS
jgi:nucleoside-diphosphate-sugar epimerase